MWHNPSKIKDLCHFIFVQLSKMGDYQLLLKNFSFEFSVNLCSVADTGTHLR